MTTREQDTAARGREAELEVRLAQLEAYRDLYDNAPDLCASIEPRGKTVIRCNLTFARALGYEREDLIGRPVMELYHPDVRAEAQRAFEEFAERGELHGVELAFQRRDGSRLGVSLSVTAVLDENGQIVYSRSVCRDITERKRAHALLEYERKKSRAIIDTLDCGISVMNRDFEVTYENTRLREQFGGVGELC